MTAQWFIARRYLFSKLSDRFVTVVAVFSFLGITIGVAALIIVMSVMNGFRDELLSKIVGLNGHVSLYSNRGAYVDMKKGLERQIRRIPGVTEVSALVEGQTIATSSRTTRAALVHGLEKRALLRRLGKKIIRGGLENFEEDTVVLGKNLADRLQVGLGDTLTLVSPQGTGSMLGTLPRFKKLTVVAVFDVGMAEYNSTFAFVPLPTAQRFFKMGDGVSGFEIFAQDMNHLEVLKGKIEPFLAPHNLRMLDWQKANATFFSVVQVERNVMFIILSLIVLVAAFNVVSSLVILVKEKTRDIAILRTMGATKRVVGQIFTLIGLMIGFGGAIGGGLLGLLVALNLESLRGFFEMMSGMKLFPEEFYFLTRLPSRVDFVEVGGIILFALLFAWLATLYPARRAARLRPIEALRYE